MFTHSDGSQVDIGWSGRLTWLLNWHPSSGALSLSGDFVHRRYGQLHEITIMKYGLGREMPTPHLLETGRVCKWFRGQEDGHRLFSTHDGADMCGSLRGWCEQYNIVYVEERPRVGTPLSTGDPIAPR